MPIKAGWQDASLVFWDFSRSNKYCIHLTTTRAIYFSRFVFAIYFSRIVRSCSVKKDFFKKFAKFTGVYSSTGFSCKFCEILSNILFLRTLPVATSGICTNRDFYSTAVCNKLASEVGICLISFYGGEWWSERLHFHRIITFKM